MLRTLVLVVSLCTAILLPGPTGPHPVVLSVSQLNDTSRKDPWERDVVDFRRLMVSRFDPLPSDTCCESERVTYMPPIISTAMDFDWDTYGFTPGIFRDLEFSVCAQQVSNKPDTTWPFVIMDPGWNGTRLLYTLLAQQVASQGYTVVTIDHPFDTNTVFLDGTFFAGGVTNFSDMNAIDFALGVRVEDISFVLDTLGIQHSTSPIANAVIVGHSFGGAAAAETMLNDTRLRGGVNLDGELFGEVIDTGLGPNNQSFILWGAEGHNSSNEPDWATFRQNLQSEEIFERELELLYAHHVTFSDMPVIVDVSGTRTGLPESAQAWVGSVPGIRAIHIFSAYLTDYFEFVFHGNKGEGLLANESEKYPEVVILARD